MATHPYISGVINIAEMIRVLRKNFPAIVNSDTVKRLGLAPNNESYVINALQFIGIIDEEGKRTDRGREVLSTHDDTEFKKAFEGLIVDAYKDLFELRGEEVWTMNKTALISYFRRADKTSEVIGTRQAAVFQTFRGLAGRDPVDTQSEKNASGASKSAAKAPKQKTTKAGIAKPSSPPEATVVKPTRKDMALTVRVEINLPTEASAETYDNIFKSIKANLLNE